MTVEDISKLAYSGDDPLGALWFDRLLWYRLRDIYGSVRRGERSKEDGAKLKEDAVREYVNDLAQFQRNTLLWTRIEQAGIRYAKSDGRTPEADEFYKAVYGIMPGGGVSNHAETIDTEHDV